MRFKDYIESDLDSIFFNMDEFTETVTIGALGKDAGEYAVIIDNERLEERKQKDDIENIYLADILFFIKKSDLGYVPKVNKTIVFNKKLYTVSMVNEDNGLLEITLVSNEG